MCERMCVTVCASLCLSGPAFNVQASASSDSILPLTASLWVQRRSAWLLWTCLRSVCCTATAGAAECRAAKGCDGRCWFAALHDRNIRTSKSKVTFALYCTLPLFYTFRRVRVASPGSPHLTLRFPRSPSRLVRSRLTDRTACLSSLDLLCLCSLALRHPFASRGLTLTRPVRRRVCGRRSAADLPATRTFADERAVGPLRVVRPWTVRGRAPMNVYSTFLLTPAPPNVASPYSLPTLRKVPNR